MAEKTPEQLRKKLAEAQAALRKQKKSAKKGKRRGYQ